MNEAKLMAALEQLRALYSQLVPLSEQKREHILAQKLDALNQVVKDEQILLVKLTEAERQRKLAIMTIAEELQLPTDQITMGTIIDNCPPSRQPALHALHTELTNLLQQQVNINETNRKLIESRLEYISFVMDTANSNFTNAYNPAGSDNRAKPQTSRVFDMGV